MKNFDKALSYSFLLLKYRDRSKAEIISRLKKKGYVSGVREQVVTYLKANNYINDQDFARLFVRYSLEKEWGPRRIEFNLKRLGISAQLRTQVLKKGFAYSEKLKELIQRKLTYYKVNKPELSAQKVWQKIVMHLVRKGFDQEVIYQELRNLGVDSFDDR